MHANMEGFHRDSHTKLVLIETPFSIYILCFVLYQHVIMITSFILKTKNKVESRKSKGFSS